MGLFHEEQASIGRKDREADWAGRENETVAADDTPRGHQRPKRDGDKDQNGSPGPPRSWRRMYSMSSPQAFTL
jgi:hypothetical protein